MIFRVIMFSLAALLLGAHFLRAGSLALVVLSLLMPLCFLVRRPWVPLLLQFFAYCAAGIWVVDAFHIVGLRQSAGQPWQLAAAILGAVAMFTVVSGLLLNSRTIRERFAK